MARSFQLETPHHAPLLLTGLLICWVCWFHASMIPLGEINYRDAFYTLDRTTSFSRQHDWLNVYSENQVSFRKPPLQYWMGALLIENGTDLTVALRAPSMLFALGSLVVTAIFAAAILPGNPWAMPAAVLLLASSGRFWIAGTTAMLDAGALFFGYLALTGAIVALRRPGWWYVVALAIGLGTLQKAPLGLVFVALFLVFLGLTARWHGFGFRSFLSEKHFRRGLVLALLLSVSWFAIQVAQHGLIALSVGIGEQMIDRFTPSADGSSALSFKKVLTHIIADEKELRWLGLPALFLMPWWLKRYDLLPLPLILLSYLVVVKLAGGQVSSRYALYFAPMVAVALAAIVATLPLSAWSRSMIVVLVSLLAGGPVKPASDLRLFRSDALRAQIDMLARFKAATAPADRLVFCNWDREWRMPSGAIAYFGSHDLPFVNLERSDQLAGLAAGGRRDGPFQGLCPTAEIEGIRPYFAGFEPLEEIGEFTRWRAGELIAPEAAEPDRAGPDRVEPEQAE